MTTQETQQGYRLDLSRPKREVLIAALEIAVGLARGEPVVSLRTMLADAAVDRLDGLCDSLFLVSAA